MSVLRNLEAKIEGLVGGAFSRAFKSRVQPVEIARKLAKEMQDNQTVSISRTYVPNQYTVWLSPQDRAQFEGYEDGVKKELSDYLLEHARNEGLALITRPSVEFKTDDRLALGEFGIQTALVGGPDGEEVPIEAGASAGDFGHTMVYSPDREARPLTPPPAARGRALLVGEGKRSVLTGSRVLIGRSRDCDITLEDPNSSPPRGASQRGRELDRDRPWLHQRRQGQRPARAGGRPAARRRAGLRTGQAALRAGVGK